MQLGRYEIESYFAVVNGSRESRQRIVYIGNNEEECLVERYYGTIRDGYGRSTGMLKDLRFGDIKSHIPGKSIVIVDSMGLPVMYFSISSIQNIERQSARRLVIVDSQIDPTSLDFLTEFDCDQAYSILNVVLRDPKADLGTIGEDSEPPVIFFNQKFFGKNILLDSDRSLSGPFSSDDGQTFRVEIDRSHYSGPFPISKKELLSGLIYDISDNREGSISLAEGDVSIYKESLDSGVESFSIAFPGTYYVRFNAMDLSRNKNMSTIIFSII